MIKTITEERTFCDICGNPSYDWTKCFSCGKDLCPEGAQDYHGKPLHAVRYPHGISTSGTSDGYYCIPCDIQLSETASDSLHNAYVRIRQLRDERDGYYVRQQKIERAAEAEVERLYRERGL